MKKKNVRTEVAARIFGNPTFDGGPYGFGGPAQLAKYDAQKDVLLDPGEEPELYNKLPGDDYDDHPHLLPHEDLSLRDVLENIVDDPGAVNFARRGYIPQRTLEDPQNFVPPDKDQDRNFPEEDRNRPLDISDLIPQGAEEDKPEYFGYGPLDDPDNSVNMRTIPRRRFEELKVGGGNPSTNDWKSTTRDNMGRIEKSTINYGQLVNPEEHVPTGKETDVSVPVDNKDDVPLTPGSMGALVKPTRHTPVSEATRKRESGEDVEELLAAMSPFHRPASNGKTMTAPEDFEVVLEEYIKKIAEEVFQEVLAEKSPPGTTKKEKKKMEAQKDAIEKTGKSKEQAASIVFGKAWNKYKQNKKKKKS